MGTLDWLAELNLDPTAASVSMGTRRLGDRPWLEADEQAATELAHKAQLCRERHDEVFQALPGCRDAAREVLEWIRDAGGPVIDDADLHPLDRAGRSVQEDLCLLRRTEEGWMLTAASLCFPSRWRLADKIGRDLTTVHDPVDGYRERLADGVDHLLDRLAGHPVHRRNWFVHPDPARFQPDRPVGGDPVVPSHQCLDELYVRSERQTLRALSDPRWVLFTIRVQQTLLRNLADERRDELLTWLLEAPESERAHRGLSKEQSDAVLQALDP